MMAKPVFGCIEAGGTKFVLGIASGPDDVLRTERIPTEGPGRTIDRAIAFFRAAESESGPLAAIGIASFGPVGLDPASPQWGHVLGTPKPGWSGTDLAGLFGRTFGCPIGFDTDVNGAALAETIWGAAVDTDVATYVTIGTGIGGGAMVRGRPLHGALHPEMGHIRVARHPFDLDFGGICPFHGDCLEGLASGPAIFARWGADLSTLSDADDAMTVIGHYLAQLVIAQQALLSPQRVILGGGVMATPGLIECVRAEATRLASGYFGTDADGYAKLIVAPGLGTRSGLLGALALAMQACET